MRTPIMSCLIIILSVQSSFAYDAARVRDILAGAVGGTICTGPAAAICAALGTEAAYWVDKGVALAVDRHFETKDQDLANKTGMTICYNNGSCIKPR